MSGLRVGVWGLAFSGVEHVGWPKNLGHRARQNKTRGKKGCPARCHSWAPESQIRSRPKRLGCLNPQLVFRVLGYSKP